MEGRVSVAIIIKSSIIGIIALFLIMIIPRNHNHFSVIISHAQRCVILRSCIVITDHQNYHNYLHAAQVMIVLTEEKKMKHLKIKLQGKGEVGLVELFEIQFK